MNWLKIILKPTAIAPKSPSLPVQQRSGALPAQPNRTQAAKPAPLPNATVIYGIGASLLFVAAFFLIVAGRWFPALVVFALGVCLTGFALHLLKHQD
jgi:hypothetical protein